ncbi:MAG: hypothetical protein AB4368_10460 [Xenococcaceae cyanobacterium]
MTDRYEQLFEHKSPQEADLILALCQLESKEEYFEHEGELVRECFRYLEFGKSEAICAYLLRESQRKSDLPVNSGTLTEEELYQLVGKDLSDEEIAKTLEIAELEQKEEYSFVEADSIIESWNLIQEASFTSTEEEVSSTSVPSTAPELGNDKASILLNLINSLSEEETEKVAMQLSQRAAGHRQQINQAYDRRFVAKFKQIVESGELNARIQQEIELSEGKELDLIAKVEAIEAQETQQLRSAQENPALPGS